MDEQQSTSKSINSGVDSTGGSYTKSNDSGRASSFEKVQRSLNHAHTHYNNAKMPFIEFQIREHGSTWKL